MSLTTRVDRVQWTASVQRGGCRGLKNLHEENIFRVNPQRLALVKQGRRAHRCPRIFFFLLVGKAKAMWALSLNGRVICLGEKKKFGTTRRCHRSCTISSLNFLEGRPKSQQLIRTHLGLKLWKRRPRQHLYQLTPTFYAAYMIFVPA